MSINANDDIRNDDANEFESIIDAVLVAESANWDVAFAVHKHIDPREASIWRRLAREITKCVPQSTGDRYSPDYLQRMYNVAEWCGDSAVRDALPFSYARTAMHAGVTPLEALELYQGHRPSVWGWSHPRWAAAIRDRFGNDGGAMDDSLRAVGRLIGDDAVAHDQAKRYINNLDLVDTYATEEDAPASIEDLLLGNSASHELDVELATVLLVGIQSCVKHVSVHGYNLTGNDLRSLKTLPTHAGRAWLDGRTN